MSGFNLGRANTPGPWPGARGRPATVLAGASGDPELAVSVSNRYQGPRASRSRRHLGRRALAPRQPRRDARSIPAACPAGLGAIINFGAVVEMSGQTSHAPGNALRPVRRGSSCLRLQVLVLFMILVGGCAAPGSARSPGSSATAPGPSTPEATPASSSGPMSSMPGPSTTEASSGTPSLAPTGPVIAWKRLALSREFSPQKPGGSARVTLVVPVVGGLVAFG